jgi:hypothetical protein
LKPTSHKNTVPHDIFWTPKAIWTLERGLPSSHYRLFSHINDLLFQPFFPTFLYATNIYTLNEKQGETIKYVDLKAVLSIRRCTIADSFCFCFCPRIHSCREHILIILVDFQIWALNKSGISERLPRTVGPPAILT